MIDVTQLTKKFGQKVAVDSLSFTVRSGMVTGFLGPNGAGKSTTMRLVLGLDRPTRGRTRVNGRSYVSSKAPITEVGALLESRAMHPGRTARNHLRALAATHGLGRKRVEEVLDLVGLSEVSHKRINQYSMGMTQRLGLAAAMLGDPETLILDEPINGLDPEGVAWMRSLVKVLASQGRTIFVSSHLMSEMASTADHVIIIGKGQLIADAPMSDLIERVSGLATKVRSPQAGEIASVVLASGRKVHDGRDGSITISGLTAGAIGEEAARRGWILHELTPLQRSLEDVYMELTESSQEFQSFQEVDEVGVPEQLRVEPRPIHDDDEDDDVRPGQPRVRPVPLVEESPPRQPGSGVDPTGPRLPWEHHFTPDEIDGRDPRRAWRDR